MSAEPYIKRLVLVHWCQKVHLFTHHANDSTYLGHGSLHYSDSDHSLRTLWMVHETVSFTAGMLQMIHLTLRTPSSTMSGLKLPPGPPRRPLIGNLLDMPKKEERLTYSRWAKKYGTCLCSMS